MIALAVTLAALVTTGNAPTGCAGPDPAIVRVTDAPSRSGTGDDRYTLTVTVANLGTKDQKANVLQSVDIVLDGTKNGEKGIPPLRAGRRYVFAYDVLRAAGAGRGSTNVRLRLVAHRGAAKADDCNLTNDSYRIRF